MCEYLERKRKKRERAIKVVNLINSLRHAKIDEEILFRLEDVIAYISGEPVNKKELRRLMHAYNKVADKYYEHTVKRLYGDRLRSRDFYDQNSRHVVSANFKNIPNVPCHRFRQSTWRPYYDDDGEAGIDLKTFIVCEYSLPF